MHNSEPVGHDDISQFSLGKSYYVEGNKNQYAETVVREEEE